MCFLPVQSQLCLSFLLVEPVLTQSCKTKIYHLPPCMSINQCYSVFLQLTEISLPHSFWSRFLTLFYACTGFKGTSKGSIGLAVTKFYTVISYHLCKGCIFSRHFMEELDVVLQPRRNRADFHKCSCSVVPLWHM